MSESATIKLTPTQYTALLALLAAGPSPTQEQIEDIVGAMVTGNTETGIAVSYDDPNGKLNFVVSFPAEADPVASAALTAHIGAADPHTQYQEESEKGAANGYAGLDAGGLVDGDDLPPMSASKKGGVPATGTPSGKYLRDDGTWQTPPGGGTHNLLDGSTHPDTSAATVTRGALVCGIGASPKWGNLAIGAANRLLGSDGTDAAWRQATESDIVLADVTTLDVSTSRHGFAPKAPNDTSKFLRGDGTWAAPAGGSDGEVAVVATEDTANATTNLANATGLAFTAQANSTYIIEAFIVWDSSATTVGIKASATCGGSLLIHSGHFVCDNANGTPDSSSFNANDVVVTTSASPFTSGNLGQMAVVLKTGITGGTWQFRFAAETTGTITVKAGSTIRYRKVA